MLESKEYQFSFDWDGDESFTYTLDEFWFDSAYGGWCHREDGSLLVVYYGGAEGGEMASVIVPGVPDEDTLTPAQPAWWSLMAELIVRAIWFGNEARYR